MLLASAGAVSAPAGIFDECERGVRSAPDRYESYLCYYHAGARASAFPEAEARLEELQREGRGGGWPTLVRGHVASARREALAPTRDLYRQAADRLAADGQTLGEVIACTNLSRIRTGMGDRAGAAAEVERALRVAQAGTDREAMVRASILEASHLTDLGEDLGRAHRALRRAEASVFPDGPAGLQQTVLLFFANLSYQLGRYAEAIEKTERLLELSEGLGDRTQVPTYRYNIVNIRRAQREERPVAGSLEEVRSLAETALRSAEERKDPAVAARAHALLADLYAHQDPARTAEHDRQCLDGAGRLDRRLPEMDCLWKMARHLAATRPRDAERALERSARIALAEKNETYAAFVWQARLHTVFETRPRREAARESLRALDAVERLRAAQGDARARIDLFANWTKDYYWLAGRLLTDAPDLDLAFAVSERMRARVLLEALEASGIGRPVSSGQPSEALARARAAIVAVQRRLLDPGLAPAARKPLLEELERLELDEADLRTQAERRPGRHPGDTQSLVSLDQVQARLHPDEVLLAFLVGLDRDLYGAFGGGSWVMAVSRERAIARSVPDRLRLEAMVPIYAGLLDRRDGSETRASSALYRELLGEVGSVLGPGVRRLVLVPDGILHELPFAALRAAPDAAPLGALYEIAVVPSATLWARWRSHGGSQPPAAVLAVADPELRATRSAAAVERGGVLSAGLDLGPLPHARREAGDVRRAIGGRSRTLIGEAATESALKSTALAGFGILHFATHAVADQAFPDRSAIVLDPGSEAEDGLLQPREASSLDLEGRAVVLSACRTAAGAVAGGEGVLSLARSFFEGGARTVVASRWRLRDDEAKRFFASFYRSLHRGATMGGAMRAARTQAMADGLAAATWAGVELLGDGDLALAAPEAPSAPAPFPLLAGLGALALALFAWTVRTAWKARSAGPAHGPGH
ncbi:MAG: CHAT domain-containing protein [Solirubrobacterales bacterium]